MTGKRRAGAPQMTGLAPMEPLSEGAEENHMLTRVEEVSQTSPMFQKKNVFYDLIRVIIISYTFTYIEMQKIVKQMLIKDIKCI